MTIKGAIVTPIASLLAGDEKEAIKNFLLLDRDDQENFRRVALKLCKIATMTHHELRGELDKDTLAALTSTKDSQKTISTPSKAE